MKRLTLLTLLFTVLGPQAACSSDELQQQCPLLFKPPFSQWQDSDLIAQSHRNLRYLREKSRLHTDLQVNGRTVILGLPGAEARFEVSQVPPAELKTMTFRHYTTEEGLRSITRKNRLITGSTPYVNSPYVYTDVTGIFLTSTPFIQESIGLDSQFQSHWIELKIHPETAVLRLEPGIYVIPGSPPLPSWMADQLKQLAALPPSGDHLRTEALRRGQTGTSPMEIPVTILRQWP